MKDTLQLTESQAIELAKSEVWKDWTPEQVVRFQLFQDKLCMDFSHFHKCIEEVLGRPFFTHEFIDWEAVVLEYLGEKEPPTAQELLDMIPKDQIIIINL